MRNIKLTIEYDGTSYAGWQQQKLKIKNPKLKIRTIQETIERTLKKILQEKVKLVASGRTDSGVHALAQVANFKTKNKLPLKNIQRALNSLLPRDITIRKIEKVALDFHSRYSAKTKIYRYIFSNQNGRAAMARDYLYAVPYKLDIELMKKEARSLVGRHNFKSFCASGSNIKDTARTVKRISLKEIKNSKNYFLPTSFYLFEIEADGFLYNMVRNILGTLLEVGRGKIKKGSIKKILEAKDRRKAGPTAPAKGLCLVKVRY